jgi:hypothetical protein
MVMDTDGGKCSNDMTTREFTLHLLESWVG